MACGCNNNAVKPAGPLNGKPTKTPEGQYEGIGGTVSWPAK